MILEAGGIAVLAHPWCLKDPVAMIEQLAKVGMQGMECYRDADKLSMFGSLAKEYNLFMLGGSDYHGTPGHESRPPGHFPMPDGVTEAFLKRAQKHFEVGIRKRVRDFASDLKQPSPLTFSHFLSSRERAFIHGEAEKCGLLHESEGQPPIRRIVVSRPKSKKKKKG